MPARSKALLCRPSKGLGSRLRLPLKYWPTLAHASWPCM